MIIRKFPVKSPFIISAVLLLKLVITPILVFASDMETLVINSGSSAPLIISDSDGFYPHIVQELFGRLKIKSQTRHMAASRSLKNANQGIDDGVIARVKGIDKKFTNLIRVPGVIIELEFVAYSNDKNIKIKKWSDLKPYNVGYIRGWKIFEKNVTSYKSLVKVKNTNQLFRLLRNKRVDVVLCQVILSRFAMKQLGYYPHKSKSSLAAREMYMYMHKKNAVLVPRLTKELENMKSDGTYQQIYNKDIIAIINFAVR